MEQIYAKNNIINQTQNEDESLIFKLKENIYSQILNKLNTETTRPCTATTNAKLTTQATETNFNQRKNSSANMHKPILTVRKRLDVCVSIDDFIRQNRDSRMYRELHPTTQPTIRTRKKLSKSLCRMNKLPAD